MLQIIIKESQLNSIKEKLRLEEELKMAQEKWDTFSKEEKEFVFEFLKNAYPKKSKTLKEATGWNTLGDIVGIFDPTGVVDLVNGISYISQGDKLFGFLSLVSAVPVLGDAVAKPVMAALKMGAPSAKALEGVLKTAQAGNSIKAAEDLARLSSTGGIIGKFVKGFGKVGSKLRGFIERMPLGPLKGLRKTILQWIDLFEKGAKTGKTVRYAGAQLAKNLPKLSKEKQIEQLTQLRKIAKEANFFKSYSTSKGILSWKTLFGGMPQLLGRNKSVRALMRQSKWWLGFLDYAGIGNFVGPDELLSKVGEEKMINKMEDYNKTEDAKKYAAEYEDADISQSEVQSNSKQSSSQSNGGQDDNPLSGFFKNLFTNQALKSAIVAVP